MGSITTYTDTDKIRGALGLTDNEVTEPMLQDQDLDLKLLVDLTGWYAGHAAVWAAYKAVAPTDAEILSGRLLQLYSTWFCAASVARMWLAMPVRISDGKDDMRRFANIDLEKLANNASIEASGYKEMLLDIEDPTRTKGYSQLGLSQPAYDPVTGQTS